MLVAALFYLKREVCTRDAGNNCVLDRSVYEVMMGIYIGTVMAPIWLGRLTILQRGQPHDFLV